MGLTRHDAGSRFKYLAREPTVLNLLENAGMIPVTAACTGSVGSSVGWHAQTEVRVGNPQKRSELTQYCLPAESTEE